MKTSGINKRYWGALRACLWDEEPNLKEEGEIALTTYTARMLADYTDNVDLQGRTLLAAFREDFAGWDEARFRGVHKEYCRVLRILLRKRGVYTGDLNEQVPPQLARLLDTRALPNWRAVDFQDFKDMIFDERTTAARLQQRLPQKAPSNSAQVVSWKLKRVKM